MNGYTYFEVGGCNWVIIGYDPSVSALVGNYTGETGGQPVQGDFSQISTVDNSPAGHAIKKEMWAISSLAKPNDEIGDGNILCFAQREINGDEDIEFNPNSKFEFDNYEGSALQEWLTDFYYSNLKDLPIIPKSLKTKNRDYPNGTNIDNQYLFPLAQGAEESFYYGSYMQLGSADMDIDLCWWLRSGTTNNPYVYYIYTDGNCYTADVVGNYAFFGARPAFVLKI